MAGVSYKIKLFFYLIALYRHSVLINFFNERKAFMKAKPALTASVNTSYQKNLRSRIMERWQLYLLLLIPLAYIIIFAYIPMGGLVIAFKNYDFTKGIFGSDWVGLKNFEKFFHSNNFVKIIRNTLTLSIYRLIVGFPLPIMLAIAIHVFPGKRYSKTVQTVTFIPHFISTVVMVGLINQFFNNRIGIYGILYSALTNSSIGSAPNILASGPAFKHLYVWSGIWQGAGYDAIIYIAALAGVGQSLHEAASIDGASRFKRVIHIDLPAILPTMVILLILSFGKLMNVGYEKVFLMQNSLNLGYSEVISTHVYKVGLTSRSDFSQATAISMFNSVINFVLLISVNGITKKLGSDGIF